MPGVQDMEITITGPAAVRSGNPVRYYIDYFNRGTDTMSGYVVMNCDPGINFLQAVPAPESVSGDQLFWDYDSLPSLSGSQIEADFNVTILPLNSPVVNSVIVEPVLGDTTPPNNYDTITLFVIGPHDPNNKVVFPAGGITPMDVTQGIWLDYIINFQNVGNASAINVVVRDTLSPLIDLSTFELISSSDSVQITLLTGREIEFRFNGINLPDSASDPLGSQGFVRFRVKPALSAVVGDVISNRVSIYFDYEFPVMTNTTQTPIQVITSTEISSGVQVAHVFPNPANDALRIESSAPIHSVSFYSVSGALLKTESYSSPPSSVAVNTGDLPAGVVLLKIDVGDHEEFVKVVLLR